jgi:hypothetical protein
LSEGGRRNAARPERGACPTRTTCCPRYTLNEEQVQRLLSALIWDENPASCWVQSARLLLEGMLAAAAEGREPSALKLEEGGDERDDEQRQWTN